LIRESPCRGRRSLLREQYNALGKFNLAAIERIAVLKYERGAAFNRQHPFVDILLSDIMESEEALDTSELVREQPPPSFQRMPRQIKVAQTAAIVVALIFTITRTGKARQNRSSRRVPQEQEAAQVWEYRSLSEGSASLRRHPPNSSSVTLLCVARS
jgi:hypothetical protein